MEDSKKIKARWLHWKAKCNKMVQLQWKKVWQFLKKLNIVTTGPSNSPRLGINPKQFKVLSCSNTCTQMFVTLFTIAQM